MKNLLKSIGIIAVAAALGLSMAACDLDGLIGGGEGGGDPALVGRWYHQEIEGHYVRFESDGRFFYEGTEITGTKWKKEGNYITFNLTLLGVTQQMGEAQYNVSGSVLTISNDSSGFLEDGIYNKQ